MTQVIWSEYVVSSDIEGNELSFSCGQVQRIKGKTSMETYIYSYLNEPYNTNTEEL